MPLLDVVLVRPEIPNNTGNIGRTCVATGCALHLVHPLGFDVSEKACRRAGLDYWPRLAVHEHASWDAYMAAHGKTRRWVFTTKAATPFFDAEFLPGDALIFGSETAGLDESILAAHHGRTLSMPMVPGERSLNLATAVCAAVYEAIRQFRTRGEVEFDTNGKLTTR
ncbi:MAG: putative tRNA (cytidine(34)-2'-O)-methyltransferase [Phycisphaerae bacterium]|nr:MAG: putative tRNA (cytidine(34)-2'-O)-methyltransferase [Phycisphaerae bacterium]